MATVFFSLALDKIRDLIEGRRMALMAVAAVGIHLDSGDTVQLWAIEDTDVGDVPKDGARGSCFVVMEARRIDLHDVGSLKLEGCDEEETAKRLFGVTVAELPAFWDEGDRKDGAAWADNPRMEILLLDTLHPTLSDRMKSVDAPPPPSCVDPDAPTTKCCICGSTVYTCEQDDTPEGYDDYTCPAHPHDVQLSDERWVCSSECWETAAKEDD